MTYEPKLIGQEIKCELHKYVLSSGRKGVKSRKYRIFVGILKGRPVRIYLHRIKKNPKTGEDYEIFYIPPNIKKTFIGYHERGANFIYEDKGGHRVTYQGLDRFMDRAKYKIKFNEELGNSVEDAMEYLKKLKGKKYRDYRLAVSTILNTYYESD